MEENGVQIECEKVNKIREFGNIKRQECNGCFSEYYCGGGCLSRRAVRDEVIEKSIQIKCNITNGILLEEVLKVLGENISREYC